MNLKSIIFLMALVAVSHNSIAQSNPTLIKILSYNIYHGENPTQTGKSNLEEISKLIIQHQPDFIALQEIDSMTLRSESLFGKKVNLIKELSEGTGYEGYFGKALSYGEGGYGVGLLVKKGSGFKIQQLPSPTGGEPRVAAWIKIELSSKSEIYFASTHLSNDSQPNRNAQITSLIAFADSLSLPTIIAGDLNFDPKSEEYKSIPSHWKDAGSSAEDNSATYSGENGKRIDYVWYQSEQFGLIDYKVLDLPYSDHFPVLVTLRFTPKSDNL